MDFQQHDIGADADGEPDAPSPTFAEGLGFRAGRPCPLAIETTWALAAAWLLLAAGNLCLQHRVHAYLALPAVLLRAAAAVACAVCATEFYDYYMMQVYKYRTFVVMHLEEALLRALSRVFRSPTDEDRPRRERVEQLWQRGTWQAAPVLHAVLSDVVSRLCDGLVLVAHAAFWWPPALMPWTPDDGSPGWTRPFFFVLYFVWYSMVLWLVLQDLGEYLPYKVLSVLDWVGRLVHWPARSALRVRPIMPETVLWFIQKVATATIVGCLAAAFLWTKSLPMPAHAAHAWDAAVLMLNAVVQRDGMVLNYLAPDATDSYRAAAQLGLQASLQAAVAALCCALMVLYRVMLDYQLQVNRARRGAGLRAPPVHLVGLEDRFSAAWYRAVAVNLMTFTAYQLFFFARTALGGTAAYLDSRVLMGSPWRILLFCHNDNWQMYGYLVAKSLGVSLATALALYFTHWLLRRYTWVLFCLLLHTETFDRLVYWYTGIVTLFTATLKPGLYPTVFLDFRMVNKPLIAHALMTFLFKPEGPLMIVSPNASILPLDPEGWW